MKISKKNLINDLVYFSVNVTLIEPRIKIKSRIDVKYSCKLSVIPVFNNEVLTLVFYKRVSGTSTNINMYACWVMANNHSKLPKQVMANDRSQLPKHNYYGNSRLSAWIDLYFTVGHKVNVNSHIISNCCILFFQNSRVTLNDRQLSFSAS